MAIGECALLLTTVMGANAVEFDLGRGSFSQIKKLHGKWLKTINASEWLDIPGELPVTVKASSVVGIRIVEIPLEVLKGEAIEKKYGGNPQRNQWLNRFLQNANTFDQKVTQEVETGPDLLDRGFKQ